MRIAIFSESFLPKWDGVAVTVCHLLEHLAARGHASLMFAPAGCPERYAETPIVGLRGISFPLYPDLKLVPPIVSAMRRLSAFQPDLVHLVNPASLGLVGLRAARQLGLPVVASYHTDIPGYAVRYGLSLLNHPLWAFFRWLHNKADLNLCPSRYTKMELDEHGFQRVRVWPGGVDTQRFDPAHRSTQWRERLSQGQPERPLLLYVGRLAKEKRVGWLRLLIQALPQARLAIVGDGPERANLERAFAGTPTLFTGYLTGQDLSSAYASADLFVFPSASETFGNVVMEAMASGLPVIAPRAGGPVDHVQNGVNGFLFAPHDAEAMVAYARQMVEHPAYRQALGREARRYALAHSWEAVLDGLLEDYQSMLAHRRHLPKRQKRYPLVRKHDERPPLDLGNQ